MEVQTHTQRLNKCSNSTKLRGHRAGIESHSKPKRSIVLITQPLGIYEVIYLNYLYIYTPFLWNLINQQGCVKLMIWVHLSFHVTILNSFYIGARHLNIHTFCFIFCHGGEISWSAHTSISSVGSVFVGFSGTITLFLHSTLYDIMIKYKSYVSTQILEFWSAELYTLCFLDKCL